MKKVLLFAGTSEGRILAEHLSHLGVETVVCVATSYGEQLMGELPHIRVLCGRLDAVSYTHLSVWRPGRCWYPR